MDDAGSDHQRFLKLHQSAIEFLLFKKFAPLRDVRFARFTA